MYLEMDMTYWLEKGAARYEGTGVKAKKRGTENLWADLTVR